MFERLFGNKEKDPDNVEIELAFGLQELPPA